MTTTPNMGLVLPTDHGSSDQWDAILDVAFATLDSHDHSTGKGTKVPAGGLNINADVSWSSAAVSHSILDLLALDFKPSPAANVVGLAAALFVSDGTSGLSANELYWRTTSGSNVKLTAGTALNVAAFTGGIGGDYAATGALVVFDDSTDSYWFQQQVGSAVRQYARMRSADVDLYEFKANPAAGVPTNRVRLASPTALAASYTLTMPAALPASKAMAIVDSAGTVSLSVINTVYPATMFLTGAGASFSALALGGTGTNYAPLLNIGTGNGSTGPLLLNQGATITSWTTTWNKVSGVTGTISAALVDITAASGAGSVVGTVQTSAANAPGAVSLGASGLSTVVAAGHAYVVVVWGNANTVADTVGSYGVTAV